MTLSLLWKVAYPQCYHCNVAMCNAWAAEKSHRANEIWDGLHDDLVRIWGQGDGQKRDEDSENGLEKNSPGQTVRESKSPAGLDLPGLLRTALDLLIINRTA